MKNVNKRMMITILLSILFILSFGISMGMPVVAHMIIGMMAGGMSFAHVWINRKRMLSMLKASTAKKLNTKTKWKYGMSLFLTVSWSICIITGILIGFPVILYQLTGMTNLFMIFAIHVLSAFLSVVLVIVHAVQHVTAIKSYFKVKKTALLV